MSADTMVERIRERARDIAGKVVNMARRANVNYYTKQIIWIEDHAKHKAAQMFEAELSAAEKAARKEEREECAQIAERMNAIGADRIGDAIRNRE